MKRGYIDWETYKRVIESVSKHRFQQSVRKNNIKLLK